MCVSQCSRRDSVWARYIAIAFVVSGLESYLGKTLLNCYPPSLLQRVKYIFIEDKCSEINLYFWNKTLSLPLTSKEPGAGDKSKTFLTPVRDILQTILNSTFCIFIKTRFLQVLLREGNATANAKDNENSTPLHAASQEGKLNVVEILVRIEKLRRRFPLIHYYDYRLSKARIKFGAQFLTFNLCCCHCQLAQFSVATFRSLTTSCQQVIGSTAREFAGATTFLLLETRKDKCAVALRRTLHN